jgi:hypothetical protein
MSENSYQLKLYNPKSFLVTMSIFAPLFIALFITSLSFLFQNLKGYIYLGFLLASIFLRTFFVSKDDTNTNNSNMCNSVNSVKYANYGNSTFSSFVFGFTISYLAVPMFIHNNINISVILSLFCYLVIDSIMKFTCVSFATIFLNFLGGFVIAGIIVTGMNAGGSNRFLFFNEQSSTKEICTQPKNQTFRCKVYKNGELIGGM